MKTTGKTDPRLWLGDPNYRPQGETMDKLFCNVCRIFHEPNDGCPVFVPMIVAAPICPFCSSKDAELTRLRAVAAYLKGEGK